MSQNLLYPVLNPNFVLVKQFGESIIYPLAENNTNQNTSSRYVYEYMTKSACDILSLCDGSRNVEDIVREIKKLYPDASYEVVLDFINTSLNKGHLVLLENPLANYKPRIYGDYALYSPIRAVLEVTKMCPLHCAHCFNQSGEKRTKEMSLEEIKHVIDIFVHLGIQKIMITGGEAFVRSDIFEIIDYCANKFIAIAIASNGYLIDAKCADFLAKYKHKIAMQISLDGNEKSHNKIRGKTDSFEKAVKAINLLSSRNIPVIVATTLNADNFDDMDSVAQIACENGAKQLSFALTFNLGRAKEGIKTDIDINKLTSKAIKLQKEYIDKGLYVVVEEETERSTQAGKHQQGCGAGVTSICIRENGDVAPCVSFDYVMGNILKDDISVLFSPDRLKQFQNIKIDNEECLHCSDCNNCYGCKALAYDLKRGHCSWFKHFSEFCKAKQ